MNDGDKCLVDCAIIHTILPILPDKRYFFFHAGSNSFTFSTCILDFLPNRFLKLLQVHIERANSSYEMGAASLVKQEDFGKWFWFSLAFHF